MPIFTWEQLIELPNADYRYLVEINLKQHYETGSDWTSVGSDTYSHDCPEELLNAVTDDGVELTAKTSFLGVTMGAEGWWFDFDTQKLYVKAIDHDDLTTGSTPTVVIYCWKYFATDTWIDSVTNYQYKPVVKQESLPQMDLSVDDIVEGIYKFNFGSFQLMNDGWFDTAADDYLWVNSKVLVYLGGENLPKSEYALYFVGRVSDMYVQDHEVSFSVKDIRVGTFSQIPVDHYWIADRPNLPEALEGKAIPIFYGVKTNIMPQNEDPDDEYISHVSSNNKNDNTFVVTTAIAGGTPSSGSFALRGSPDELYTYTSWASSTFSGVFPGLKRDYTDTDIIIVTETNNWKFAGHIVDEITEIRKNETVLTVTTHYTPDLANAEFVLKVPFDASAGDLLELDGIGKTSGGSPLVKGADIAEDILKDYLGFIDDDLDLASFVATNLVRTYALCMYLDMDTSSREVLQTVGRSIIAFLAPTEDGKLSFEAYEPTVETGTLELFDEDYWDDWKVEKDDKFIKNSVQVQYDKNPKTQEFKSVQRNNYEVLYKYGVRETLALKTYVRLKADAEVIAEGVRDMCSKPITVVHTSFGMKGFKLFPTRKVKITRERAADSTGSFTDKVFRIRTVSKDTSQERTSIIGMDDLQTLGESFCYVCFSCQNCVTEEAGCTDCYTCQLCYTTQGGCQACDTCQLCVADEGGCDSCNLCEICDSCEESVGECAVCEVCNDCENCFACENTVNTCSTCQNCYGCQDCDTCESYYTCAACDTCENCVTVCQNCNTSEACTPCDVCDTCQSWDTCGNCDAACDACNTCQQCVSSYDACSPCDVCVNCETWVNCNTCDTCEQCNAACQLCNTAEECTGCDTCYTCDGSCDECQICVSCESFYCDSGG